MDAERPLSDWLEGYLFDRRIVVLRGSLDSPLATRIATELMTLDATGDETVTLQLDSPGGPLTAAFTVIDVVEALGVPVTVQAMGRVEKSAVAVVAAGSRRIAMPHTQFRFGDPEVSFEARASEAASLAAAERELLDRYHACLARCTGHAPDEIAEWCRARRVLDAAEAVRLGVVDEVSRGATPLRRVR